MTLFLSKILGPVLLLRGISVLIDRRHFAAMLEGLEKEVTTVAFSAFPVVLLMVCTALAVTPSRECTAGRTVSKISSEASGSRGLQGSSTRKPMYRDSCRDIAFELTTLAFCS